MSRPSIGQRWRTREAGRAGGQAIAPAPGGPGPARCVRAVCGSARLEVEPRDRLHVGRVVGETELQLREEAAAGLREHVRAHDEVPAGHGVAVVARRAAVVDRDELHADAAAHVGPPRRARGEAIVEVGAQRHDRGVVAEREVHTGNEVEGWCHRAPLEVAAYEELVGALREPELRSVGRERFRERGRGEHREERECKERTSQHDESFRVLRGETCRNPGTTNTPRGARATRVEWVTPHDGRHTRRPSPGRSCPGGIRLGSIGNSPDDLSRGIARRDVLRVTRWDNSRIPEGMMRSSRSIVTHLFAALVAALSTAQFASAQPRVSGQVFADALAALEGYSVPADSSAFRFRRLQVTAAAPLDTTFSVLVQLEVDDGELTSQGKSAAFMKQAWLRWGQLRGLGDLTVGLTPTPTWALSEAYWGYRSIEKTVMDLQGLGFATDIGLALQQAATPAHRVGWHLMLSNDNGQ